MPCCPFSFVDLSSTPLAQSLLPLSPPPPLSPFPSSLRTILCVRFKSEVIACGVIFAAARRASIPLPLSPPWWLAFDASLPDILAVCRALARLYKRGKAQYVAVGKEREGGAEAEGAAGRSFVLSTRAWEPPADAQVR